MEAESYVSDSKVLRLLAEMLDQAPKIYIGNSMTPLSKASDKDAVKFVIKQLKALL